jgi:eukaryotic-like serine/threonine-protein kinase
VLQPTGTGTAVAIETAFERVRAASLFPDGKRLLLIAQEPGKKSRLYVQDIPAGKPLPITEREFGLTASSVSPDGNWITAYGDWSDEIYLLPTGGGPPRNVPNSKDLDIIRWTPDGKFLFGAVVGTIPARVVRIEVATGRREPWKDLAPSELSGLIGISPVFLTPDGKSYVYGYGRSATSDLYLVEGLK